MDEALVEKVARAICLNFGDVWDEIPDDKQDWVSRRMTNNRLRDVNAPMKDDYIHMARGAITAMQDYEPERPAYLPKQAD